MRKQRLRHGSPEKAHTYETKTIIRDLGGVDNFNTFGRAPYQTKHTYSIIDKPK